MRRKHSQSNIRHSTSHRTVSVSEFKANPSRYFAAVKAGGEVWLTEHGRLIAHLSSLDSSDDWSAMTDILVATGLARRPIAPLPASFFNEPMVADPDGCVLRALLGSRSELPTDE